MSEGESTADREARRTRRLGPPCRRFGLLDGMIAVAALSLVVFGCRWYYNQSDSSWPYELHEMAGCCLMAALDLMLTLRLRRPRRRSGGSRGSRASWRRWPSRPWPW